MSSQCRRIVAVLSIAVIATSCDRDGTRADPASVSATRASSAVPAAAGAPAGTAAGLAIGSWNIEWFGDPSNGPANEPQQLANAAAMLADANADIWGLAEIVDGAQWERLKAALPGYDGVLSNDKSVIDRGRSYGASEQKLAVLFRTSAVRVRSARLILAAQDNDFAGRPPLEVRFRDATGGNQPEIVVIVVHMKARNDEGSWQRRQAASRALKNYLDRSYPTEHVIVVGDWNDGLGRSITAGKPSPYQDFEQDAAHYRFLSRALADRGVSSTTGRGTLIDHHLATDELAARELPGTMEVRSAPRAIRGFRGSTSDHFPVVSHFRSATR